MSGWDFEANTNNKVEFTKFPVGITKIRVIDEEPYVRWTHWLTQHKRSINCPGRGCPICEIRKKQKANKEPYSYGMSRKFALNVINRETGNVEIMEQGIGFFQDLRDIMQDLKDMGHNLIEADIKVRRRGTGKDDTSYRLDIDEIYTLTDEDKKLVEEKIDLEKYFKPHTNEQITRVLNGESWEDVMYNNEEDEANEELEEDIEVK